MVVGLLAWQQKSKNFRISKNLAARHLALSWFGDCARNCFARHTSWFTPRAFNQLRVARAGRSSFGLRKNLSAALSLRSRRTRSPLKTSFYLLFIAFLTELALSAWARDILGEALRVDRSYDLQQPEHMLHDSTNSGKWCHPFEGRKTTGNHGCNIATFTLSSK
jgi:hypothetical protein